MDFRKFSVGDYPKIFENLRVKELNSTADSQGYVIVNLSKKLKRNGQDVFIIRNCAPYDNMLYVLPNDKMIEHDYISGKNKESERLRLYVSGEEGVKSQKSRWTSEFLLDDRDPNAEARMRIICDNQRHHVKKPIVLQLSEFKEWRGKPRNLIGLLMKGNAPFTFPPFNDLFKILLWGKRVQELNFPPSGILNMKSLQNGGEYRPTDFDFAYSRISDDEFLFVPMTAFVAKGKIRHDGASKEMKIFYDDDAPRKDNEWIHEYIFSLTDITTCDKLNFMVNGVIHKPQVKQEERSEGEEVEGEEVEEVEGEEVESREGESQEVESEEVESEEKESQEVDSEEVESEEVESQEKESQEVESQEVESQEVESQEESKEDISNSVKFDVEKYLNTIHGLRILHKKFCAIGESIYQEFHVDLRQDNGQPFHKDCCDLVFIDSDNPDMKASYLLPMDKFIQHKCDNKLTITLYPYEETYDPKRILNPLPIHNWTAEFQMHPYDSDLLERVTLIANKQRLHHKNPIKLTKPSKKPHINAQTLHQLMYKSNIPFTIPPCPSNYKYDVYNKRIQQFLFKFRGSTKGFYVPLINAIGEKYKEEDFDFAFIRLIDEYCDSFYLIPMSELIKHNIIGNTQVKLPLNPEEFKAKHNWVVKYMFHFDSVNIYEKLVTFITEGKFNAKDEEAAIKKVNDMKLEKKNEKKNYDNDMVQRKENKGLHIIGRSPLEEIEEAVRQEYHKKIRPKVCKSDDNDKALHMERYATRLALYAINLKNKGTAEICPDGCISDFFYYEGDNDKCLGIQVKTTRNIKGNRKTWGFSGMDNDYSKLLVYFRSLEQGIGWLVPYDYITSKQGISSGINIGTKNSKIKWNKFRVLDEDLASLVHKYYKSVADNTDLSYQSLKSITTSISSQAQVEQDNRNNLIKNLAKFEIYVDPTLLENMSYDSIIRGLRTQEKTALISKSGTYLDVGIRRSYQKGVRRKGYKITELDLVLIHLPKPYDRMIYLFPAEKLQEHGFVSDDLYRGKKGMTLWPDETLSTHILQNWTSEFLLHYDDPNFKERFIAICDKQVNHDRSAISLIKHKPWNREHRTLHELFMHLLNIGCRFATSGSLYKYIIGNKRFQEITFTGEGGKECNLKISYSKVKNKQRTVYGYTPDDFDVAYCRLKGEFNNLFLLIPMKAFEFKDIINFVKSQKQVLVPRDPSVTKHQNLWVKKYLFDFNDKDIGEKIDKFMRELDEPITQLD